MRTGLSWLKNKWEKCNKKKYYHGQNQITTKCKKNPQTYREWLSSMKSSNDPTTNNVPLNSPNFPLSASSRSSCSLNISWLHMNSSTSSKKAFTFIWSSIVNSKISTRIVLTTTSNTFFFCVLVYNSYCCWGYFLHF